MSADAGAERDFAGRVLRAGGWAGALRIGERSLGLVRTIILARLLAPVDFGLFGVAVVTLTVLDLLSQAGLSRALVQRRGDITRYLNTVWTVQVTRGLLVAALLALAAVPAARFFEQPAASALMWTLALAMAIEGLANVGVLNLERDLEFRGRFLHLFSGSIADFVVAVSAALLIGNAWALAYGYLAGASVRAGVSYLVHPYRPRLAFDRLMAAELWGYGRWVWLGTILVLLATQGDDLFVAKALGLTALALYQMAYLFSNSLATEIVHVISGVTFPAFSEVQKRPGQLLRSFLISFDVNLSLLLPATTGILLLGSDFVRIALGEQWMGMVTTLYILSGAGLARAILATGASLLHAVGRPDVEVRVNAVRVVALAAVLWPLGWKYGIEGVAGAVAVSVGAALPVWWYALRKAIPLKARTLARLLMPSVVGTVVMIGVLGPVRALLSPINSLEFTALVILGIVVYTSARLFRAGPPGSGWRAGINPLSDATDGS